MIKNVLKNILGWMNKYSVTVFCRIHYRNQAKRYCKKNNIVEINSDYSKQAKEYWKKYGQNISTIFHQWYSGCNGIKDPRYIPEDLFYDKIERFFNNVELEQAYVDKGMYGLLYSSIKQPTTIIVNINGVFYDDKYNIICEEEVLKKLNEANAFVIKPTRDSGGGKNVRFINLDKESVDLIELLRQYSKDYIVQKPLVQHPVLASIHKESINTIRAMSIHEDGKVRIVSTVLRIGVGDSNVDNECSGGINCGVSTDGYLSDVAFDGSGKKYDKHPQGFIFKNGYVPSYTKIIDIIIEQHKKMPHFGLISWDFTVGEDGEPIMIELNLRWQGLNFHQLHNGPLFGADTENILGKVFRNGEN